MILVTVGTQAFPFDRLIRAVDQLDREGSLQEPVFMQIGTSDYVPKKSAYERYLSRQEMTQLLADCSLLITHSGVGMIREACSLNKPVIVVPRQHKLGEHVDDHQMEIARAFEKEQFICVCEDINQLKETIDQVRHMKFKKFEPNTGKLEQIIFDFIRG